MAILRLAWNILVGIKDALVLILLIAFFAGLAGLLSGRPERGEIGDGPLILSIDGVISEQPAAIDPLTTLLSGAAPVREYAVADIDRVLERAANDDRVTALVLDLDRFLGAGQATLSEVGRRIDAVRAAGKPVHAYAAIYTNAGYQLAAHADTIWLDPMGGTLLAPPGGSTLYFADALERFGVKAHIYRAGRYKAAVEPFMLSEQSNEAAEDLRALRSSLWDSWRAEVKKSRPEARIDDLVERPAELLAGVEGDAAKLAMRLRLVDALATPQDFARRMNALGREDKDGEQAYPAELEGTRFADYLAEIAPAEEGAPIAVIPIVGSIIDGDGGPGSAAADTISGQVERAVSDDVAAIVLRIDSPGGSVPASEQIRRSLVEARRAGIPVVASMANVAASGGYWIATSAQYIVADPATITGSIGVFAILPSFEGTLARLGINADGVKPAPLSGQPDLLGGTSEAFDRSAEALVGNIYNRFVTLVAKSRDLPAKRVDDLGQGRIWAGAPARRVGLVDALGGIDRAGAEAAKLAGLAKGEWHLRYYGAQPGFFARLITGGEELTGRASAPRDAFAHLQAQGRVEQRRAVEQLRLLFGAEGAQALCLACADYMAPAGGEGGVSDARWSEALLRMAR